MYLYSLKVIKQFCLTLQSFFEECLVVATMISPTWNVVRDEAAMLRQALCQANDIDLSLVAECIQQKLGWSVKRYEEAEKWYRRMVAMTIVCNLTYLVPFTEDIDEVWHFHILCTEQYIADCQKLYGKYLHHRPKPWELIKEAHGKMSTRCLELFGEFPWGIANSLCCDGAK